MPTGVSKGLTDQQIIDAIANFGIDNAAKMLGCDRRNIQRRRILIEKKTKRPIVSPRNFSGNSGSYNYIVQKQIAPHRQPLSIPNGIVIIGGDAHYWPGCIPLMHRAFCLMLKRFREAKTLRAVICNGDMMDFPRLSRWPVINWETQPEPSEEIEFAQDRMHEIEMAAGQVPKLWPGGNHDLRFNNWIAAHGDKLKNIKGTHLKDHFPNWQPCWSAMINEEFGFKGATFIKHRITGGVYAIRKNIDKCGTHIITNHLHASNVWQETKLPGDLYGVDAGMMAAVNSPQFLYLEDNPVSWREGFVVLEYVDGALMYPDLVKRHPDKEDCILFRGETIEV